MMIASSRKSAKRAIESDDKRCNHRRKGNVTDGAVYKGVLTLAGDTLGDADILPAPRPERVADSADPEPMQPGKEHNLR